MWAESVTTALVFTCTTLYPVGHATLGQWDGADWVL
jgi:hypothetical protein